MENEKYGIELDLVLDKFRKQVQQAKSEMKSIPKSADGTALSKLPASEWRRLNAQLGRTTPAVKEISKGFERVEKSSNKFFEKGVSKIKGFGLALLGIRSIWTLVSRASSAYLAQDTELANKLQAAWIGLGAILAPIINFIATIILKLVSIINGFIKALTGVDLIAKASAKSMKSAAGGANSLKKALAGFDELNNLDSDSGGAGGLGGFADAFANIDTDFSETMKNLENTVDKSYQNIRKKMVKSIEEMKKNLKVLGFSDAFINMYDSAAKGAMDVIDGFVDAFRAVLQIIDGIISGDREKILNGFKNFGNALLKQVGGILTMVFSSIGMFLANIWDGVVKAWNMIKQVNINAVNWFYTSVLVPIGQWFANLWNGVKNSCATAWNWIIAQFNGWKNNIATFVNTIASWFAKLWSNVLSGFTRIWNKIANTVNKVGGKLGLGTIPTINSYAVGTNYVPEDQLAMLHKGEAVVPKKFNSAEYFGGSEETNAKLDAVIEAINNININPYTTIKDVGKASLSYINNKSRQLGESVVM